MDWREVRDVKVEKWKNKKIKKGVSVIFEFKRKDDFDGLWRVILYDFREMKEFFFDFF